MQPYLLTSKLLLLNPAVQQGEQCWSAFQGAAFQQQHATIILAGQQANIADQQSSRRGISPAMLMSAAGLPNWSMLDFVVPWMQWN